MSTTFARLSVNIDDNSAAFLQRMKYGEGFSFTETIRRAVAVYWFFKRAKREGYTIRLLDRKRETVTEIEFLL